MDITLLDQFADELVSAFINPQKRVFWGYLFMAFAIGIGWLCWQHRCSFFGALGQMLNPAVWWSHSARADYKIFVINRLLMLLFGPWLVTRMVFAGWLFYSLHDLFGGRVLIGASLPQWAVMFSFTLIYFLLDDASRYLLHRWLHQVPWLWAFHKVHHSATRLTPVTVFRAHPVEALLFTVRSALVQGVCIAAFVYFFGDRADLITIFGSSFILFIFNVAGANLRHSHIAIGYGKHAEKWLISPAQHQLHHSTNPSHFDCNFGVVLAIWDRLGGSLIVSKPGQRLRFGLNRQQQKAQLHTLHDLYLWPFYEAGSSLWSALLTVVKKTRGKFGLLYR
ncbi:sterol desaturase family protein [Pontibacter sp. JAM-7]|uniref:sterol desaturase family protein n=1 Tax=Pontibacter sp. JAM-7 TaxID=3366581 RepID=UPI003AF8228E